MKRIICVLTAVFMLLAAVGCGGGEKKAETKKAEPVATKQAEAAPAPAAGGKKVLVAYFSWGGTTRNVAKLIQEKTGGDIFEIKTETPYPKDYHQTVELGKKEKADNVRPKLAGPLPDLKQYDVILLGYPIWWYIEPMAVKTFVEAQDLSGKTILPFATSGGSDIGSSVADLQKTLPKAQVKDGLLANSTGGIDGWLKDNGVMK
ncbi:MAG: flavodoxin family protein [Acidaminococcaceae bacterium]|nr:flavodoxin family protein [Acidaminococcaceae bacterium]